MCPDKCFNKTLIKLTKNNAVVWSRAWKPIFLVFIFFLLHTPKKKNSKQSHLLPGSSDRCGSGGWEWGAAAGSALGVQGAGCAPGAGCWRSEQIGAAAAAVHGGCGASPGRGLHLRLLRLLHPGSAGRSRRSAPAGWHHWGYPATLWMRERQEEEMLCWSDRLVVWLS